eukprot:TRINITY_DN10112_c0_g1_i1.p1 TRINITY_DN10112_c0_g1~~TRINITY_DN10112_c0_g1_i1.p1  ORF type:complete len:162 (+),score=49.81 TRINITY_DN10112_c0_g1_i1:166-651(+)
MQQQHQQYEYQPLLPQEQAPLLHAAAAGPSKYASYSPGEYRKLGAKGKSASGVVVPKTTRSTSRVGRTYTSQPLLTVVVLPCSMCATGVATTKCERCNKILCLLCAQTVRGHYQHHRDYCPPCAERVRTRHKATIFVTFLMFVVAAAVLVAVTIFLINGML